MPRRALAIRFLADRDAAVRTESRPVQRGQGGRQRLRLGTNVGTNDGRNVGTR